MRRAWLAGGVLALVVIPSAAAVDRGAVRTPRAAVRVGIADSGDIQTLTQRDLSRYLDGVKRAGAAWIRIGIYWAVVQHRGPTAYDWSPFDRVVKAARRRRLAVLGTIVYAPRWAAAGSAPSAPPADFRAYAAFAGRVAQHYRRDVHAFEIWNEPNIVSMWPPAPDPRRYTEMLKLAYTAIKHAAPSATVVSGGLSPDAAYGFADANGMNPLNFLEQMYAEGAHGSMDAVGWHPYNFPWGLGFYDWSAWSQMAQTRPSAHSIMRSNGDGAKKIWATEWGAPTGTSSQSVSEAKQAQLVTSALARLRAWPWAGPSFFYSYRDKGTNPSNREQNFGLVRFDWSPKPASGAFRRIATQRRSRG